MHIYIIRRLLLMIPTLLGITVVVFTVMAAAPGGLTAASLVEGQNLDPQAREALEAYYNKLYGLNQPPPVQYLRWLNNISPIGFTFAEDGSIEGFSLTKGSNLGISFRYGRDVLELVLERLPVTLLLNVLAIPIIYVIAIAIGVRAAVERGRAFDVGSSIAMLALWSVPTMLAGVLMIAFFANEQYWHWFPTAGLNDREALYMPFMPHWGSWLDVLILFSLASLGAVLFTGMSQWMPSRWRVAVMTLMGVALGVTMAGAAGNEPGALLAVLMGLALAALFGAIAYTDFGALRTAVMGLIGIAAGVALAFWLAQGGFVRGFLLDRLWHLFLPVLCLAYGGFAFLSKLTRTAVLENLLADYARTARAKGVSEKNVLWRHVFRNSLLPLITVAASLLPSLLAGSVIVESIFSIDGMGKLAVEAVQTRDRELVLSITMISGILTLFGYLVADLCYAVADPRVSYE